MAKKFFTDEALATFVDETKSYVDSAVSTKADSSHSHSISNVTNLQSTLDGKVPTSRTVNGKALSANISLTASDVGAAASSHTHSSYVNQNAFSNVTVGSTTIAADTTTDTLTLVAGSNVTITPDATNDKITIAATDTVYTHPTSHPASMITGLATVATSGSYNDLSNKPTIPAAYTHPTYTARTGKPTANQTPAFGGTATVSQITSDTTGHVTGATDRTITIPSTLSNGTGTAGLIKTSSTVTSSSGYTACPVINGVPYYKDTNNTYSLSSFGITATAAELNYCDGVTSNIQTQINTINSTLGDVSTALTSILGV